MSGKVSAGILLYRHRRGDGVAAAPAEIEVLLVHPGGPFWARKDDGAWTIPKGELAAGEEAFEAARRELTEETGLVVAGPPIVLAPVRQAGGKTVQAFAVEGDFDVSALRSNTFTMVWPPRSGVERTFPEVDRAAWFTPEAARVKLLGGQVPLIDGLLAALAARQ